MNFDVEKNKKRLLIIFGVLALCFVSILFFKISNDTLVQNETIQSQSNLSAAYTPLTNGFPISTGSNNLAEFLELIFRWGIGIAIILAILMIIFGGLKYMTTDAVFDKSEGREIIRGAIAGLILVLSAWIILYTINPEILNRSGRLFNAVPGYNLNDHV